MMKMIRHFALRTFLLGAALVCALAVCALASESGVITGDVVNVRKGPGTSYPLVEMLAKGKQVTVLGEENGWYHIKWNNSEGYVKKDYLAVNGVAPAKAADATVTGGSAVNVRSGPGTSYSRVTTLAEGKRVAVLGKDGDWYQVSFGNTTGYILKDYLAVDGSTSSGSSAKPAVDTSVGNATITGGGSPINVRVGPGTSYSRVTTLSEGKRVTATEKRGDWYRISFGSTSGYVLGEYLSVDSGVNVPSAETPKQTPAEQPAAVDTSVGNATVTGGTINVRSGPDTSYDRVTRLSEGKRVTLLSEEGGWFKVSFDGKSGYILGDFLKPDDGALDALVAAEGGEQPNEEAVPAMAPTEAQEAASPARELNAEPRMAYIAGGTINVRSGPGTEFDRITLVSTGNKVKILGAENGWYLVAIGETQGYVHGDYVTDEEPPADSIGVQVASQAAQFLGVPYVYGGASTSGFDCSGFTMWLYKQHGYSLPHSASGQYANCGYKVSRSELQPGDIVFFSSPGSGGRINHCAVYVGGGEIIHARYSVGKVYRNSLSENYYSTYYAGAIRIA